MKPSKQISFGTSGHRGIIGKTFTLEHTHAISYAIAQHVRSYDTAPIVVVGYDSRLGNSPQCLDGSYTKEVVSTLIDNGVSVWFCDEPTPTPCISWMIDHYDLSGGIILTASHNPPQYNGIKFNLQDGAPAPVTITKDLEKVANTYLAEGKSSTLFKEKPGKLTKINRIDDFCTQTLHNLSQVLGQMGFNFNKLKICVDAKHGSVANTWKTFFRKLNNQQFFLLNDLPKHDFGGVIPNPTDLNSLTDLISQITTQNATLGIANDPDGDRHIILDETGTPLAPEETAGIIISFFAKKKLPIHGIYTTLASSHLLKKMAQELDVNFSETAVGFKYFTNFLKQGKKSKKTAFAIESSGGFSTSFHTLEKCGFLPALLLLHIIQVSTTPLSELKKALYETYGVHCFEESELSYNPQERKRLITLFDDLDPDQIKEIIETPLEQINRRDGCKLIFEDDSWILIRFSGTEPVIRLYAEANSSERAKDLIKKIKKLFFPQ